MIRNKIMFAVEYQEKIDWSNDRELCKAVSLSLWLIVDKSSQLKRAIKISAKKFDVKMAPVERIVKDILPINFFSKRAKENMPQHIKDQIRANKIAEYNAKKFL